MIIIIIKIVVSIDKLINKETFSRNNKNNAYRKHYKMAKDNMNLRDKTQKAKLTSSAL
jgi:hypothetical protein